LAKILVIEDNPMVAEMISDFLGIDGHQVTVSAELPEVMRLVAADKPDLILADNSLDGYDVAGWEIVRIVREQEGMQSIPVVGMSGFSSEPDRESARASGCDEFLPKPIVRKALSEMVNRLTSPGGSTSA
jgi:two-component system cell cycle response regulator DivK